MRWEKTEAEQCGKVGWGHKDFKTPCGCITAICYTTNRFRAWMLSAYIPYAEKSEQLESPSPSTSPSLGLLFPATTYINFCSYITSEAKWRERSRANPSRGVCKCSKCAYNAFSDISCTVTEAGTFALRGVHISSYHIYHTLGKFYVQEENPCWERQMFKVTQHL